MQSEHQLVSGRFALAAVLIAMATGCDLSFRTAPQGTPPTVVAEQDEAVAKSSPVAIPNETQVSGSIAGTDVTMLEAEFDESKLWIYEHDGWGSSPSLLIFLFDRAERAGQRIEVADGKRTDEETTPHIHYRWWNDEGRLTSKATMGDYDMTLVFGEETDAGIPGTIEVSTEDERVNVKGSFIATRSER